MKTIKMIRLLLVLPVVSLLCSCISIEFPNLISDSVKAGKEVLGGVSGSRENPDKTTDSKGVIFSNTVIAEPGAKSDAAENQCLNELENQAKEKLGKNQIAYKVIAKEVSKKGDKLVATCSLKII